MATAHRAITLVRNSDEKRLAAHIFIITGKDQKKARTRDETQPEMRCQAMKNLRMLCQHLGEYVLRRSNRTGVYSTILPGTAHLTRILPFCRLH